ncbi:MAG: ABC transporter ATP-binding protein [Lachnospiraceae bacterium]|nr:ABC transporter ATP-binding protein [Lachnospiraceae bacterium]
MNKIKNILWLAKPYLHREKIFMFVSILFWVIILPLCRIIMVVFPQQMVDLLDTGTSFRDVIFFVLCIQGILLAIPVFEDFFNAWTEQVKFRIGAKIKEEAYKQAVRTDYHYVDNPKYYQKFSWTIEHHAEQAEAAYSFILRVVSSLTIIASLTTIIAVFNPWIFLLTLTGMILRTIGYSRYNRVTLNRDQEMLVTNRKLDYYHRLFYMKEYAADLKTTRLRQLIFAHFGKTAEESVCTLRKYAPKLVKWAVFSDIIYRVVMSAIILLVAYSIYRGDILGATSYLTVMLSVEKLEDTMYEFFELMQNAEKISLYAMDIRDFYSLESIIETEDPGEIGDKLTVGDEPFSIEFDDVCFSYPDSDFGIHNLQLKIEKGEKVAIVGENGVGKSTLLKLLLRLYVPSNGDILIDGESESKYNIHQLRNKIGVSFQKTHVYALSLEEYLGYYANESCNTDNILSGMAEKIAAKHGATAKSVLTREFDEEGIVISEGEAQQLALERVMGKKLGLLILDEPSASLDPLAEYEMNKKIMSPDNKVTTIIIAHRLSTIREADRIFLLDKGRIIEEGTHDELVANKGKYYEMFSKQAENYVK